MTKHDEVRQILHETGFKFADGRSALEMTDEEVEKFVIGFISAMAEIGRSVQKHMMNIAVSINQAVAPHMADMQSVINQVELAQRAQQI